MIDIKKQKKQEKIAICFLFSGFFAFGLFLFFGAKFDASGDFQYNQKKEAFAAESKPITCRKQTEVKLPAPGVSINIFGLKLKIPAEGISAEFGPNEYEIPTGEITDRTENLSNGTTNQLQTLIDAAGRLAAAAKEMAINANQCGADRCATPGCETKYKDCEPCLAPVTNAYGTIGCIQWTRCPYCYTPPCGGQACPSEVNDRFQTIISDTNIVSAASDGIKNAFTIKPHKPVGYWWLPGCHSDAGLPPVPGCLSEKEFILKELERARSGDYEIFGAPDGWERRPPGLKDCVIRPQDMEQVIEGEKTGKFLFSCKTAVMAGIMRSDNCYGQNAATNTDGAENYYCCQ